MFNKTNDPHLSDDSHPKNQKTKNSIAIHNYIVYATIKKELLHHTLKSKQK